MFVRTKISNGRKLSYLVESYRDEKTHKTRQRHIAYVDLWPNQAIAKLIKLHETYNKALVDSRWKGKDECKTDSFMRQAKAKAGRIKIQIADFKHAMTREVALTRKRADRRIKGKRQSVSHTIPPYSRLLACFKEANLRSILSKLAEDENYGPVSGWGAERKSRVRPQIEPFKKLLDKLWADLQV